ncbi:MAG: hypothetical protein RMK20_10085 [Verrucomicrobiales bacterium]|nr:hypothetical protein [Verrucomicrobiales bacterium]
MTMLPLISRELRAQARQPFTYTLRALGVLALLVGGFMLAAERMFLPMRGAELFGRLHGILFIAVWVLVPLGAADCLSRERREGTLPLLFLTPLKPAEIVLAKSLVQGLRAMTLVVAALPVLTVPFLVGGVAWEQVALSAASNLSALGWALGAALVASAAHCNAVRAQAMAMLLGAGALGFFIWTTGFWARTATGASPRPFMETGLWLLFGWIYTGGKLGPALPAGYAWVALMSLMLLTALLALMVSLGWAALWVRAAWQEQPLPPWAQRVETYLSTPRLGAGLLRWWLRRSLARNPIGWLERRTWQGRLVVWSWLAVLVGVYTYILMGGFFLRQIDALQAMLGWLLLVSMAASAAGSFRRERETGVLELLLVSPLSTREIVMGRLRGLWAQFLPAFALWAGVGEYLRTSLLHRLPLTETIYFVCPFVLVPVVGLYFSLRSRSFLTAFVLTVVVGLVLPRAAWWIPGAISPLLTADLTSALVLTGVLWALVHAVLVAGVGTALIGRLKRRDFPLERALT